jgi:hypothetical protein
MSQILKLILNWAEVWALFIPLSVLLYKKVTSDLLKPIALYVYLALVLNFLQDYIQNFKIQLPFTANAGYNGFIYNTHSVFRLLLFSWFFIKLKQPLLVTIKKIIPAFYILFFIVNFSLFENYIFFSSRLLACETLLLLVYCLIYYLNFILHNQTFSYKNAASWIVTGLSIYVIIDFPIFLFFTTLSEKFEKFAIHIWYVQNIAYIILCCFLAKGLMNQNHERN